MSCGCGGAGGGSSNSPETSPVILSGVLESRYAGAGGSIPPPSISPEVAAADTADMSIFSAVESGGVWVVLLFVGLAAYWMDKTKRESE